MIRFRPIVALVCGASILAVLAPAASAKSHGSAAASSHGSKGEKVTICHRTGSASNPFVTITISTNGLNGHRHHDGDIIPAPAGGCPKAAATAGAPASAAAAKPKPKPHKVTICHHTGSASNPFVTITISTNGLNGHRHHDGDLIPAPAGGCPVSEATTSTSGDTSSDTTGTSTTSTTSSSNSANTANTSATNATNATTNTESNTAVDAATSTDTARANATPETTELAAGADDGASGIGSLPFTGLALGALALIAAALIAMGAWTSTRRRRLRGARTTDTTGD